MSPVNVIQDGLAAQDKAVLRSLAENMTLAESNDVNDTFHWLERHYNAMGIEMAVSWFVECAIARDAEPNPIRRPNWKNGILKALEA
jgi:hypothetical protein